MSDERSGLPSDAVPADPGMDSRPDGWSIVPEEGGFIGLVGPFWTPSDEPGSRFGFLAEARHANLIGVVQGGMLMTFADRSLGIMAWAAAGDRPVVTISFEMQFVGSGRIGSFIEFDGEIVRRTSGLVFMRGLATSGGRPVASCQGVWKILSERRAALTQAARGGDS